MAAEQQHTKTDMANDQENLAGFNSTSDTHPNANTSSNSPALTEVDPKSASNIHSSASATTEPQSGDHQKKGSIAEAKEGPSGNDITFEALEIASPDDQHDEDQLDDDIGVSNVETGLGEKKKKNKKKKPKSQRGLNNPTGFEEYYVDPPVTPAEFEEEQSIYDISLPFAHRIEKAIQRFLAKRNLDSTRKNLFTKYLIHGGIEAGQNMFSGGLDRHTLETSSAAEIAELRATTYVGADKIDIGKSDHVVDFEGCLGSFLAHTLPSGFELPSEERINYFVGIIRNFLNYLLHHEVCPDYQTQIYGARTLCDRAVKELWALCQCKPKLPGDFNKSCSEIFGGTYQGMWSDNQEWMQGMDLDYDIGISPDHARKVFKYALAANADDDTHKTYREQLKANTTKIASVNENTGFEVTEILFPTQEVLDFYAQPEAADLKAVGKLRAKTWIVPTAAGDDLTEEEEATLALKTPEIKHYEFWIEEDILSHCVVGMKVEATVTELSFGVSYFDVVHGVHCSFYQLLPNELMAGWREPEKEWLPMRKKAHGVDSHEVDFDDLPGEVGEENEPPDDNPAFRKEAAENTDNGMIDTGNEIQTENEKTTHKIDSGGSCDAQERLNAMSDTAVDVRETGERLIQVPGNPNEVVEKIFSVEPVRND